MQDNRTRLFRNTIFLYIRTLIVMVISLYTSRVVLAALGVDDFGIYNVVGGVVAMFSVVSSALSTSISRYLTFELGKNDLQRLQAVFSTSINIQLLLSIIIIVFGGFLGSWLINNQMNIPSERIEATNWVFICAMLCFVLNLLSLPFNACIIAHEKMPAFAYISMLDAILKLAIVFSLSFSVYDKLIMYAFLLLLEALFIQLIYGMYCLIHFPESHYRLGIDKVLLREMTGFASWNFLTNCAYIFNTQGINILINIFFGVSVNAARGIAIQMETAVKKFVTDFTTAINPQITKNYAQDNMEEVYSLVCIGARFSFFLIFVLGLPLLLETPTVLQLWLNQVPDHTVAFFRLSLIGTMLDCLGGPLYTACMATGKIRKYVIYVTSITFWAFPLSWLCFFMNFPVESCYVVLAGIYGVVLIVKLYLTKELIGMPLYYYAKAVIIKIILVVLFALPVPLLLNIYYDESFTRLISISAISILISLLSISVLGLTSEERKVFTIKIKQVFAR